MLTQLRALLRLAWPLLIAQITQTMMGVVDTIMAGRYSATDMAAVAIGYSIIMPVLIFMQGIVLALPPVISRLNGARQIDKVAATTQQMLWLALSVSGVVLALVYFVPWLFAHFPMDANLRNITSDYVQYVCLSAPFFAIYQVMRNYCEGLSITKPSMVIMLLGLLVNIPANYVLVYGKWGFPELGGAGCGLATGVIFIAMCLASSFYVAHSRRLRPYQLFARWYNPKLAEMRSLLSLGLPIALTLLFEVTLFGVVALLLAPFGANIVAAHQIALNFSSLVFMLPMSIGMALSIRIGHLMGEQRPEQARIAYFSSLMLGLSLASMTALFTVLARTGIGGLYTEDTLVIQMAASLMLLAALFQFSDAIQVISANALRGYKDTTAMFLITFVSYWLVGLPVGCILGLTNWIVPQMQAAGFWIGFIAGLSCAAVLLGWRVRVLQHRLLRVV